MAMSARTRAELLFGARLERPPQGVYVSRGRLVLLGEHLDHQRGRVLAVPVREGVAVAWAVRPDTRVAVWAMNARAKDRFTQGAYVKSGRRWADLARGACARVAAKGGRLPGLDLLVFGDLVPRVGMGSSAAYLVSILRALYAVREEVPAPATLAEDVAAIEAQWGGVACGPMDPYVAVVGAPGDVVHLDCRALTHQTLALPDDVELGAEDAGATRALAQTPYNERRRELAEALRAVQAARPEITSLAELSPTAFRELEDRIPEPPRRRARHVVTESERVERAVEALNAGDMATLGSLMRAGHESLRTDFESTLPEIDARVEAVCQDPGVFGARLQGAGWGGRIAVLRRRARGDMSEP